MDKRVPHLAFVGWVGYFFCVFFRSPWVFPWFLRPLSFSLLVVVDGFVSGHGG
nr:MAG TPA: hypothetical protein [Caudoviricetes sp.]